MRTLHGKPSSLLWWSLIQILISLPAIQSFSTNPGSSSSHQQHTGDQIKPSPQAWNGLQFDLDHFWTFPKDVDSHDNNDDSSTIPFSSLLNSIALQSNTISANSSSSAHIRFGSKSQAKRACRNGEVWVLEGSHSDWFANSHKKPSRSNIPAGKIDDKKTQVLMPTTVHSHRRIRLSYADLVNSPLIQAHPSTILNRNDQVWIMVNRRWKSGWKGYPVSVTKNWFPPPSLSDMERKSLQNCLVFENNDIALINKPEGLTTIAKSPTKGGSAITDTNKDKNDLQSLLGFLLQCPPIPSNAAGTATAATTGVTIYHPRPVHRLDKATSGLVLVAKSDRAMKQLSRSFATRRVTKTYSAIVVQRVEGNGLHQREEDEKEKKFSSLSLQPDCVDEQGPIAGEGTMQTAGWNTIDYPIDGKSAVSTWRLIQSVPLATMDHPDHACDDDDDEEEEESLCLDDTEGNCDDGDNWKVSLLQVRPRTGRTHQVRRHLAYNLGSPIVGDLKYGNVQKSMRHSSHKGPFWKEWHWNQSRMYLTCHALEFPYDDDCEWWWNEEPRLVRTSHDCATEGVVTWNDCNIFGSNSSSSNNNKCGATIVMVRNPGECCSRMTVSIPLPSSFEELLSSQLK